MYEFLDPIQVYSKGTRHCNGVAPLLNVLQTARPREKKNNKKKEKEDEKEKVSHRCESRGNHDNFSNARTLVHDDRRS